MKRKPGSGKNFEFEFPNISCNRMSLEHVAQGWLTWINDPKVTQYLSSIHAEVTEKDLENYLDQKNHILFLACYDSTGIYFGNLKLYEIHRGFGSFGRIIGLQTHRGLGYGREMVNVAHALLFNVFNYEMTIVGNLKSNEPSRSSKLALGYQLLSDSFLESIGITLNTAYEYYGFNKSNYEEAIS